MRFALSPTPTVRTLRHTSHTHTPEELRYKKDQKSAEKRRFPGTAKVRHSTTGPTRKVLSLCCWISTHLCPGAATRTHSYPEEDSYSKKMMTSTKLIAAVLLVCLSAELAQTNQIGLCIRNCAQCKKMFGAYFEGQLCAETCVKFKGKLIPDCEDVASIGPFINRELD